MIVQHNITAMNANRMLGMTTNSLSKSTEKLSSGYRINRAADDAAGLTISEKMRKQIRGLDQASTNAEDGVSAVQTAEGALTEVHSMLQRMNELAVQASNGTNSQSDRQAIQDEISQLTTEIDRVAETTKFNETYLLKGGDGTKKLNLKAHDAGLKGTLTDNGDGTATFVMDELKVGDSVSIGGKNYTIGATADEAKTTFDDKVKKKGDKLTINGKSIEIVENYDNGQGANADAKKADLQSKGQYTLDDAKALLANGCFAVAEGANMPSTREATDLFVEKKILFMPGKAANAGGVATSGLEQSQNSMRLSWTFEEVDAKLHDIMVGIFAKVDDAAKRYGAEGNYVAGANIAGFEKVANAMIAQGIV